MNNHGLWFIVVINSRHTRKFIYVFCNSFNSQLVIGLHWGRGNDQTVSLNVLRWDWEKWYCSQLGTLWYGTRTMDGCISIGMVINKLLLVIILEGR